MSDDHLDKETNFAVALTESGIEAKAKSRTVAALDRLGGNILEWGNVLLEVGTSRRRAKMEGEAKIIAATAEHAVKLIGTDDAFAARAISSQFGEAARKQLNKDAVLEVALEDLQTNAPTQEQSNSGPESLSDEFITRFEEYASGATTEQLRERWGRVLATEIRRPGSFSRAVLRVIDEIDPITAALFEAVCENRIQDILPITLTGELKFDTVRKLVEAGLLTDPGLGHSSFFSESELRNGTPIWIMSFGDRAIAFDRTKSGGHDRNQTIVKSGDKLGIPIYILTEVGTAVSSILEDKTSAAIENLIAKVTVEHPDLVVFAREGESLFKRVSGQFSSEMSPPIEAAS